jgi:hypothetical protein
MRAYPIILLFFLACSFAACQNVNTGGQGGLLSDGYISWTTDGVPFIVHDSITAGDPGENLLYGIYQDSTLSFHATLPYDPTAHFANPPDAEFFISHCRDTGMYILSTPDTSNGRSFAQFYGYPNHSNYLTDASLQGAFHLTRLDTVHSRIAGTFTFTAMKFPSISNLTAADSIKIENGVVFDFPVTVEKN